MKISFDPAKRALTLANRNLDFAEAAQIFAGPTFTQKDDRFDYGEERFQCNDREKAEFTSRLG